MRKRFTALFGAGLLGCALFGMAVTAEAFDGGSGTADDPYQIATAEQLDSVREDLGASYILTADIDLSGYESWEPLGSFVPYGEPEEGEETSETPDPAAAFTGDFDGDGHTVSGLRVSSPGGVGVGLFGCSTEARIANLAVSGADVTGGMMAADVIGYAHASRIEGITLTGSVFTADGEGLPEGQNVDLVGGIVGAGMDTEIVDCTASSKVVIPDGSGDAGLVGGGLEDCSLRGNTASGSIEAGNDCFGIGGVFGCGFAADEIASCRAEGVEITAGDRAYLVGGVVGYAGNWDLNLATEITECSADVTVNLGNGAARVGGIIGGGFYFDAYKEYFPLPTSFVISDCTATGAISIASGTDIGIYAGNEEMSVVTDVSGDLMIGSTAAAQADSGAADSGVVDSGTAESMADVENAA